MDNRTRYVTPIAELSQARERTLEGLSFGFLCALLGPPNTTELERCEKIRAAWAFIDDQGRKGFVWAYDEDPEICARWSASGDPGLLADLFGPA